MEITKRSDKQLPVSLGVIGGIRKVTFVAAAVIILAGVAWLANRGSGPKRLQISGSAQAVLGFPMGGGPPVLRLQVQLTPLVKLSHLYVVIQPGGPNRPALQANALGNADLNSVITRANENGYGDTSSWANPPIPATWRISGGGEFHPPTTFCNLPSVAFIDSRIGNPLKCHSFTIEKPMGFENDGGLAPKLTTTVIADYFPNPDQTTSLKRELALGTATIQFSDGHGKETTVSVKAVKSIAGGNGRNDLVVG